MTGRACRASVINGTRRALAFALKRTISADLRVATNELRRRLGAAGRVQDDVLGCAPDLWDPVPLEIRTGGDDPANAGLRRSIEFLESQPWLPASARSITESVLQAIGRPPVGALVDSLPKTDASTWESLCIWATPQRRDYPGRLRMARRALELLTGSWPWGSHWVETTQPSADWVDVLLCQEARVVLDYAPLTKCPCQSCVRRRIEIENARHSFFTRGADCAPIRRSPFNLS